MLSVGLYGQQSFMDFRLLFSKIAVASILVLDAGLCVRHLLARKASTNTAILPIFH